MTHALSRKQLSLALSCAIALGVVVVPGAATAQVNPADTGYLTDQRDAVPRSGFGLCWHTGTGPRVATIECDPTFAPAPLARVEPAPRPVALAAVTPEVAPKVVPERVTLDADALFDFDKAVLRPAGRAALDDFVGRIKGIDPEMIIAVGHTDRLGS